MTAQVLKMPAKLECSARGAIIGDPLCCIEARALCDLPKVEEAYIGSGKDAYVIFTGSARNEQKHALHFTIPAKSGRIRDMFDVKGPVPSLMLLLKAPTNGRTLEHRRLLNRARAEAVRHGAKVKKRDKPAAGTRVARIGVAHRPRAQVKGDIFQWSSI